MIAYLRDLFPVIYPQHNPRDPSGREATNSWSWNGFYHNGSDVFQAFHAKPGLSAISMDSSINTLSILAIRPSRTAVFSR